MEQREASIKLFLKYISDNIQVSELQQIRAIRHYLMTILIFRFWESYESICAIQKALHSNHKNIRSHLVVMLR